MNKHFTGEVGVTKSHAEAWQSRELTEQTGNRPQSRSH